MTVNNSTSAIGYSDLYNSTGATAARTAKKSLGSADFMKLLATQFTQQDPMKPMEDTAFVAQMAQFTNLEQTQSMSSEIARLRAEQQLIMGNSYLGRTVTVMDDTGKEVSGVVSAMENTSAGVLLKVGDSSYALSSVTRIEQTPSTNTAPTTN